MADQILVYQPRIRLNDVDGSPLAAGSVTIYRTGTTMLASVYADSGLTTPLDNPLDADAAGRLVTIFYDGAYEVDIVIRDEDGALVDTIEKAPRYSAQNAAASGVTFLPVTGNTATNVQDAVENLTTGKQNADADLTAFADITGSGFVVRSAGPTAVTRSIAAGDGITITNNNGVAANPEIAVTRPLTGSGTAPYYGVRAWGVIDGTGTPALLSGANVGAITDNGTGDYTVAITEAITDAQYAFTATANGSGLIVNLALRTTTSVRFTVVDASGSPADASVICFTITR